LQAADSIEVIYKIFYGKELRAAFGLFSPIRAALWDAALPEEADDPWRALKKEHVRDELSA
jgi:hypothetical protein